MPPPSMDVIAIPVLREPQGPVLLKVLDFRCIAVRQYALERSAVRVRNTSSSRAKLRNLHRHPSGRNTPAPRESCTSLTLYARRHLPTGREEHSTTAYAITRLGTRCSTICGLNQMRRARMSGRGRGWARVQRATCADFCRTGRKLSARP